jgi:hypothetical protein
MALDYASIEKLYFLLTMLGITLLGYLALNLGKRKYLDKELRTLSLLVVRKKRVGAFQVVERIARHDGFCGRQGLQIIVPRHEGGQKSWKAITPCQHDTRA